MFQHSDAHRSFSECLIARIRMLIGLVYIKIKGELFSFILFIVKGDVYKLVGNVSFFSLTCVQDSILTAFWVSQPLFYDNF